MIASTSTESSRSLVPRLQPFHNPLTRNSTLTILLKISLAQHQLLDLNDKYQAKANNRLDLTSDPTGALALRMGAILAKDVIKVVDADLNNPTGPTLRTTHVTRVNRLEAIEGLLERMLNKIGRIALHLNEVMEAFFSDYFRPFSLLLLGFSLLALANVDSPIAT